MSKLRKDETNSQSYEYYEALNAIVRDHINNTNHNNNNNHNNKQYK